MGELQAGPERRLRGRVATMDPQSSDDDGTSCRFCGAYLAVGTGWPVEPHKADCLWVECGGTP